MKTVRTTFSLPSDQHEKLQALAEANDLSVAWVVRQAVGEFLDRVKAGKRLNPLNTPTTQKGSQT